MHLSGKYKFYLNLGIELILSPWLYFQNFIKWNFGNQENLVYQKSVRVPVTGNNVAVCIHEWGGYEGKRKKNIKNIPEFECGLDYQLQRFQNYVGKYNIDLTVTISDAHLLKKNVDNVKKIEVPNIGMDFSGYETFYESIKNKENQYVILTNSSVNKLQVDFIDDYIDYFKSNNSIGMMGVSFNSKMYQSLIRNNFNPHLQSFFLLTTTEVLREIINFNKFFPGKGVNHKLLLIREGEVKLSKIVLDLGYKLACILENGKPFLLDKSFYADNGRKSWNTFFGDYRIYVKNPNAVNSLKI